MRWNQLLLDLYSGRLQGGGVKGCAIIDRVHIPHVISSLPPRSTVVLCLSSPFRNFWRPKMNTWRRLHRLR
jgi:hypothetical protein